MSISNNGNVEMEIYLINLSGPLTDSQYEAVRHIFREISEQGVERVIVNLIDVPFIDSRGLAALVAGYRIFGSDSKRFRLAALQAQPRLVFELTGFDYIFEIFDSVPEAVELESSLNLELPQGGPVSTSQPAILDLAVN